MCVSTCRRRRCRGFAGDFARAAPTGCTSVRRRGAKITPCRLRWRRGSYSWRCRHRRPKPMDDSFAGQAGRPHQWMCVGRAASVRAQAPSLASSSTPAVSALAAVSSHARFEVLFPAVGRVEAQCSREAQTPRGLVDLWWRLLQSFAFGLAAFGDRLTPLSDPSTEEPLYERRAVDAFDEDLPNRVAAHVERACLHGIGADLQRSCAPDHRCDSRDPRS